MAKKNKLQRLLKALQPDPTKVDFAEFDNQVNDLKSKLTEKVQIKTLDDVNATLDKFKRRINLDPLLESIHAIEKSVTEKCDSMMADMEEHQTEMDSMMSNKDQVSKERIGELKVLISDLKEQVSSLEEVRKVDIQKIKDSIPDLTDLEDRVSEMDLELSTRITTLEEEEPQEIKDWTDDIEAVRKELMNRIGQIGGGSMNRQIFIGGVDPLTKYTDINLKAGSNVTLTYTNNDTTKKVDITITSSGGGGSVIGTTRSIQTLTVSSVIGTTASLDQVILANGGIQITLPTAVGDTNLYTIKNVGTSSVLVNTTGGQTIDNDTTIIMPVRYTSVDIISNSTDWNIT